MDPNANLREQLEIARVAVDLENAGFARLAELVLALDEWRTNGGFDPYTAGYPQALCVARDLVEQDALDDGFANEYLRGVVNLLADLFGVFEQPVDERMDDVLADLRRVPFGSNPRDLPALGIGGA